ncbi:MAG: rhamnogalacturonan acetylesterase [Phenylobacterium sp.]|uniref:rhamnogalacturonan acetylesterase n=1 Tax=Phenylobacterium sp. TaxID=1871053 RepID=UPI0027323797|nr:rhamnogalacturonan acetylesterase [Phenylobacterium sp.]MDP3746474.1 rhamnogalacturonan acetylesterase [Phenylobacterium sp.]
MRLALIATLALALAPGGSLAEDARPTERVDAPAIQAHKIILVGDSTLAPNSGWGGAFCARRVKSSVACVNLGRGGRSTRSYRAEGSWEIALAEARVPGYRDIHVLIQFGHNDQSSKPERWTERTQEFPDNLRRYVREVRATGARPVLVTPLTRREFKNGELQNTLEPWAAQTRAVAAELDVPLIDLNARSAALVGAMGAAAAAGLAQEPPTPEELAAAQAGSTLSVRAPPAGVSRKFDYTHLGDVGAETFAALVATELARTEPALRGQLVR